MLCVEGSSKRDEGIKNGFLESYYHSLAQPNQVLSHVLRDASASQLQLLCGRVGLHQLKNLTYEIGFDREVILGLWFGEHFLL